MSAFKIKRISPTLRSRLLKKYVILNMTSHWAGCLYLGISTGQPKLPSRRHCEWLLRMLNCWSTCRLRLLMLTFIITFTRTYFRLLHPNSNRVFSVLFQNS